jgi:serine/threonine protein kinase
MEADESIETIQEANLLSKLDNPYILKYHDSFLDGEYFCIVTEYCEVSKLNSLIIIFKSNLILIVYNKLIL